MAYYAALVSLLQLLEDIIHRDRYQDILPNIQQKSAAIYGKFNLLKGLLDDYSPKEKEAVDFLERRIRDVAYQAQDIIESQISGQIRRKDETQEVSRSLISALPKAVLRLLQPWRCGKLSRDNVSKEYQDLENVKAEVDFIVEELMRIMRSHPTEDNLQLDYYSADAGRSSQASDANDMVGFEEHLTMIKDQLCGEASKLRVVSITGIGGIGKTTLARNIFEDGLVVYKFDCRAWVTISQDYHLSKVLLDILDSMKVKIDEPSEAGDLGEKIYKNLKGTRYLIVMDDIWDTKVWDEVKRMLPDDSNGSRIMITTRISDVAFYADRFGFYHQMQFLDEEESWNLFRKKVFCPPELENIGRVIAKNCRGLPLAIVVVTGLLSKVNKTRYDWEKIARNVCSVAAENDERFVKILSLSYNHLPHHLRPLLLYIGGFFPQGHRIRVSKLVKLWVAEGFLKPIESKSLEVVAEEYLEDLVNRNLVLVTKKSSNGKIKHCDIHDLLRDLCKKIMSYENFLHVMHSNSQFHLTAARNVRRLYAHGCISFISQFTEKREFSSHLHSFTSDNPSWDFLFSTLGFNLLKVLDVPTFSFKVFELFHLRYMSFTHFYIPRVPPSISLLQNLQTFIIQPVSWVAKVCSLPSQIRELPNLRHIMSIYFKCEFLEERTAGEPPILKNLQTLSWAYDVRFTNEVIEMIPNLQKLKVRCDIEEAAQWQRFRLDNLFHLRQLESLNLTFSSFCEEPYQGIPLPENFAFPLTLKKLSLKHCKIPWKEMTAVGSLPNLQVLKLRSYACVGEKWEPVEGEFPKLKFLFIRQLDLKYWEVESTHFPTLEYLKIDSSELEEIPPEIGEISTLEMVEVNYNKLAAKSAMKMLEEQRDMGNDVLQVRVHP